MLQPKQELLTLGVNSGLGLRQMWELGTETRLLRLESNGLGKLWGVMDTCNVLVVGSIPIRST